MIEITVKIVNKLGLHARAAAKLVSMANSYSSTITIQQKSQIIDGKNMMNVMLLAARKGSDLTLVADGDDEEHAMVALKELIESGFGEKE